MTFRNPLTSLSASQITPGVLPPGVTLPAGQVSAGTLALEVIAQALANGTVKAPAIATDAVTSDALATGSVLAAKIATGAVTSDALAAAAVTAVALAGSAVTAPALAAAAVTATAIATGAIVAGKIAAGAIVASNIAAGTITATQIAAGTLTATQIAAGAIGTAELAATAIDAMTITGTVVRSAASGNRYEIKNVSGVGTVSFYAGISGETPAQIKALTSTGVAGDQSLAIAAGTNPITLPATGAPTLELYCYQDPTSTWQGAAAFNAALTAPNIAAGQFDAPLARVVRTTAQATVAGAWTPISWTAATKLDGVGWAAGSPTRLTATYAGWYVLNASAEFSSAATNARYLAYRISGGAQVRIAMSNAPNAEVNATTEVYLTAGQYLEVLYYDSGAENIAVSDGTPRATLRWVRR